MKHKRLILLTLLLLLCVSSIFNACNKIEKFQETNEIVRVTSPDSVVDAFITQNGGGGATVGFTYTLYIVPKGNVKDKYNDPILLADRIEDLNVKWIKPRLLDITFQKARIFKFSNFWSCSEIDNFKYEVEVKLNDSSDSTYFPYWKPISNFR